MRFKSRNWSILFSTVIVAVLGSVAGVAYAAILAPPPGPPDISAPKIHPTRDVSPPIAKQVKLLSERGSSIPAEALNQLSKVDDVISMGGSMDLAVAVAQRGLSGKTVVIPTETGACLFVPAPEGGYGGTCGNEADVLAGHVSISVADVTVTLVPNDVTRVIAKNSQGLRSISEVESNLALNRLANPTSLQLDGDTYRLVD